MLEVIHTHMHTVILFVWQDFFDDANHKIIVTTNTTSSLHILNSGFTNIMAVKHLLPQLLQNQVQISWLCSLLYLCLPVLSS